MSRQLQRYLVVGGAAYVLEMFCLLVFRHVLHLSNVASVAISFWIGLVVAFVLQKFVAFENHDRRLHIVSRQIASYGLLVGWNYLFTLVIVDVLGRNLSVYGARTLAILLITSWNFIVYKRLFAANANTDVS